MTRTEHKYVTKKKLKDLNIIDNFLFNELTMQENPEDSKRFCTILIENLLGWKLGNVTISSQRTFQGLDTDRHGICLDVLVEAITHKDDEDIPNVEIGSDIYDIEPNTYKDEDAKRARFYTALIDGRALQSGTKYKDMKNIYLIIITPYDPFGQDSMIYTVKSRCLEIPDMQYEDGVTSIFLYTRGKKNVLGKKATDMLHFIEESTTVNAAANSDCQTIMNMVDRIKVQREVGVRYMKACELEHIYREEGREAGRTEGLEAGRAEGLEVGRAEGIVSMGRKFHISDEEILSELQSEVGLTLQEAQEYLNNN